MWCVRQIGHTAHIIGPAICHIQQSAPSRPTQPTLVLQRANGSPEGSQQPEKEQHCGRRQKRNLPGIQPCQHMVDPGRSGGSVGHNSCQGGRGKLLERANKRRRHCRRWFQRPGGSAPHRPQRICSIPGSVGRFVRRGLESPVWCRGRKAAQIVTCYWAALWGCGVSSRKHAA